MPRTHGEFVARRKAFKTWSEASFGFLGRSPDYMAAGIAVFLAKPELFTTPDFNGADNVRAFHRRMSRGHLYESFTLSNPQTDRTRSASEQEENYLFVRAVEVRDGGVVVRGATMVGTAALFGDEIIVGTIEPLAPQDIDHALCFSVPVDTPGLSFVSRASYEANARGVFDNPLSSRFDENDALLVCDNVFVPWERMLVYRNVEANLGMWWSTPADNNFVHQASTRFWTKLEFLTGLAILIAKANNTYELPPVQTQIGRLMGGLNIARSMVLAAEANYEHTEAAEAPAQLSWVANAYLVSFGGLLLLSGRAADFVGRRALFTAGLGVLAAASLAGSLATSAPLLIAARAGQGLGAARAAAAAFALLLTLFPDGPDRHKALGVFAAMAGAGGAAGPALGGVLTSWLGWQSTFAMNVIVALGAAPSSTPCPRPPRAVP